MNTEKLNNDSYIIFQKIIQKKVSSNIIYQDKIVTAFEDINPQAPVHILIVPNKKIKNSNHIKKYNKNIFGHMIYISVKIAKIKKIEKTGYRLVINCNHNGGQEIQYLHLHLLGGKHLGSMIS